MGCATSKPKVCHNCHTPYSSVKRSHSMYIPSSFKHNKNNKTHKDHHNNSEHLVHLTSSTLGSLKLDSSISLSRSLRDDHFALELDDNNSNVSAAATNKDELLIEAKTWSQMLSDKIPRVEPRTPVRTPPGELDTNNSKHELLIEAKTRSQTRVEPRTPVKTPPGEPETINAWELMEDLEDITPLRPDLDNPDQDNRVFLDDDQLIIRESDDIESSFHSNDTSVVSDFDPEVISTFRKALEELPPANPFHLKPLILEDMPGPDDQDESLKIQKREYGEVLTECNLAHQGQANENESLKNPFRENGEVLNECKMVHHGSDDEVELLKNPVHHGVEKLVIYFTSLRGVRKTYEDCCHVRVILKALGVKVDERDVSMHSGFKDELKELLGEKYPGGGLPKVFLGKKYIGGADEIRRMNEDGKLEKLVEKCERIEDGGTGCEGCGDTRFVPCETCSGSCKIYYEAECEESEVEEDEYGFQRCPDCNENGLIRCPVCCD